MPAGVIAFTAITPTEQSNYVIKHSSALYIFFCWAKRITIHSWSQAPHVQTTHSYKASYGKSKDEGLIVSLYVEQT